MIEEGAAAAEGAGGDGVSAGQILKQAREASGLHVAALAVSLKVPVRKLEALEDNRWDEIGDAVFIRALASSVCRTLKVDPQPVLARLPQTSAPRLMGDGEGINTPFRAPSDGPNPTLLDQLSRPVVLAVIAILLAAVVVVMLPSRDKEKEAQEPVAASADTKVVTTPAAVISPVVHPDTPASAPATLASALAAAPASMAASGASASMAFAAAAMPAAASHAASAPAAAPADAARVAASASEAPLPTTGTVVFRTKGPSWIEVVDAKGVVVVRKTLASGEVVGASGAHPLAVTVGRVDVTDVQVRGKPFNMQPVSKDNVARFQVQ